MCSGETDVLAGSDLDGWMIDTPGAYGVGLVALPKPAGSYSRMVFLCGSGAESWNRDKVKKKKEN